jgi:tellurium resistance protein TerD
MINLKKGQGINLSKDAPMLKQVRVGLGWDTQGREAPAAAAARDADPLFDADPNGASNIDLDLEWSDPKANAATTASAANVDFDLDVSLFMLGANGKLPADEYFLFFNNLRSPDGAVVHQGDNRTGVGEGDDETLLISLPKIDPTVERIVIVVTIHEARERGQSFANVGNAYIRLVDQETGQEVLRYSLNETFFDETAVVFGELEREGSSWRFKAVGQGSRDDLQTFVDRHV